MCSSDVELYLFFNRHTLMCPSHENIFQLVDRDIKEKFILNHLIIFENKYLV